MSVEPGRHRDQARVAAAQRDDAADDPRVPMEDRYRRMLLELPPAKRLEMACRMFSTAQELVRAGIVAEGVTGEPEIRRRLFMRFYGRDIRDEAFRRRAADEIASRPSARRPA